VAYIEDAVVNDRMGPVRADFLITNLERNIFFKKKIWIALSSKAATRENETSDG